MKTVALVLCLVAAASASSDPFFEKLMENQQRDQLTANINEYLDTALKQINIWIVRQGMDPLPADPIEKGFDVKIGFIRYHGKFSLTHGWLQGLSTLKRKGDAEMSYESMLLNLRLPVEFDSVHVNYDYVAKIMNLGPKGGVVGKIKDLQVYVDITLDTKTLEMTLQDFKIKNAGKISIKFSGNPLVDWLSNILTGLATTLLHNVAIGIVQQRVREIVEQAIDNVNSGLPTTY